MAEGNDRFTISVDAEIFEYEATIEVDLTEPQFEPQVMAAAGHFQSLRRKTKRGAPARAITCPECGQTLRTTKELPKHRREGCT